MKRLSYYCAAVSVAIVLSVVWFGSADSPVMRINIFDVGQGDAILVRTPDKQDVLIDGGPDIAVIGKLTDALGFFDRRINIIFLTHPHADHLDGLVEVIKQYQVDHIYMTGVVHHTSKYLEWLALIKEKNIPVHSIRAPDKIMSGDLNIDILYPLEDLRGRTVANLNNTSLVLKINYGAVSVLLAGDLEEEGEAKLIHPDSRLKADILKVGHHGSDNSSTEQFINLVRPELAVISVGLNNPYGHPSSRVIRRIQGVGGRVWRTDKNGDLKIDLDANDWRIHP